MSDVTIAAASIAVLFVFILAGAHIGVALALVSFVAMILVAGDTGIAIALLEQTAASAVNDYIFAVVPLFILMGAFMTHSRAAGDLYAAIGRLVRWLRGGLAIATVFANAVFAAVAGVSVASAAVFSTIFYPEMVQQGYSKRLALGAVAGSSVLGMLIPPSLLLILYGILTGISIGDLFVAGVIPGIVLSLIYSVGIVVIGTLAMVGRGPSGGSASPPVRDGDRVYPRPSGGSSTTAPHPPDAQAAQDRVPLFRLLLRAGPVMGLIVLVIGGIWGGIFTPTEASADGALGALVLGVFSGMTRPSFLASFKDTASATGSIMLLLIAAQMYSRMLAVSGLVGELGSFFASLAIPPLALVAIFVLVLVVLGAILDSSSIILLTVPLIAPVLTAIGTDMLLFGIVMVVAVEVGMLTPPFGMVAFAMSGVLGSEVDVYDIFVGALPFFVMMMLFIVLLVLFPPLSTWLPGLV